MAYIGNEPGVTNFVLGLDRFNGTGACTQFTLTRTIDDANALEVLVNSIQQDPISSYSVSGGLVTFTEAPSVGSNNIVVIYRSTATITFTNVTTAQIADGAITSSKLASGLLPTAHANAAFNTANTAFNSANAAFSTANAAVAVNTTQNNSITAAFTAANAAVAVNTTQNNSITVALNTANAAFITANNANANGSITAAKLDIKSANGVGAVILPAGTTAQRPSGTSGSIRYNTSTGQFEGYTSTDWGSIGGGATGGGNDTVFFLNANTVTANYTITTGFNALSAGPITINANVTVNIANGANWVVV